MNQGKMGRIEEGMETKGSEIYGFKKKKQMTEKQRKPDKK